MDSLANSEDPDEMQHNALIAKIQRKKYIILWLVGLMLSIPVNSYGHVGTVSSPNHSFFLGKLD